MNWQNDIPNDEWDKTLFESGGHFLQSSHWATFQLALGKKIFYAQDKNWMCLAILETSRTGNRLYCPYGPLAKNESGLKNALAALKALGKQKGAVFVRVEPVVKLKPVVLSGLKLKPALKDIQPHVTWVQDLTKSGDELLSEMTATNRNLWRNHANKNLSLEISSNPNDIKYFISMMAEVAQRNRILQHSDIYYKTMAEVILPRGGAKIYIARHKGKPVASALCLDSTTTRYYTHAASHFEARKLHPGTPLLAQMIFDAKSNGQKQFDFVGVAPIDAPSTHRWAGLTKFKQSFGGEYKQYLGTWEMPVNKLRYSAYRAAYKLKNLTR